MANNILKSRKVGIYVRLSKEDLRAKRGVEVVAFDYNPAMIENAKKRCADYQRH